MRYREIIETQFPNHKKTYVFLTPDGHESDEENDQYEPISYDFIVDTLERIISVALFIRFLLSWSLIQGLSLSCK